MSEPRADLSRIELLVLARLSGSSKKPPSVGDIAKLLAKMAKPAKTEGEWKTRLVEILVGLRARSLVDEKRRLTEAGRRALAGALGIAKRTRRWREVHDKYLPALALGVPAEAVAGSDRLQTTLLAGYLGVERRNTPSQIVDELVLAELGLPPGKLTLGRIREHLIARRTGVKVRGGADEVASRLATHSIGASNGNTLRSTLVARWLNEEPLKTPAVPEDVQKEVAVPAIPVPQAARPLDDGSLAAMVTDAVRGMGPEGRFGPHKVFISAIWRNLADELGRRGMSIDDLKKRLIEANRAGLLALARADLVGAMDPKEVQTSEIQDRGSRFHFVLDDSRLS